MHSFSQKPKATQPTTSTKFAIATRGHLQQSPDLTGPASPRPEYDFSRIPVHHASAEVPTKLLINEPGDSHEQDADRAAAQVMRTPFQHPRLYGGEYPGSQTEQPGRKHAALQTKRGPASGIGQMAAPPVVHEILHSPGQQIDAATRDFMEPRFGRSFADVRVHTDAPAAESARSINALAYTSGRHIVLGAGYNPRTDAGRNLLAHELAHTIQQGAIPNSGSEPSTSIQRRPMSVGFIKDRPEIPNQTLPTVDPHPRNLTKVTINNIDTHQTEVTTMDAVTSSPEYVDNGIVSVGADIDNAIYLRIKVLRYQYSDKPDAAIPPSAIRFESLLEAFTFVKFNHVIYPVANGEVILNDVNTPNLLTYARMKMDQRAQAMAEREQIAWTVYAFAGAIASLGEYASSMESIHSAGFAIGEKLPSRSPKTMGIEAEPVGAVSTRTNEISTLTNLPHDVPGEIAIRKYSVDSGFSAAYDPATKTFVAVASGEQTRLISGEPVHTVDQYGGHEYAQGGLTAKLGQTDSTQHVGFVIIWKGNDTVQLRWNSGTINKPNFNTIAAPVAVRAAITSAVQTTLNVKVTP